MADCRHAHGPTLCFECFKAGAARTRARRQAYAQRALPFEPAEAGKPLTEQNLAHRRRMLAYLESVKRATCGVPRAESRGNHAAALCLTGPSLSGEAMPAADARMILARLSLLSALLVLGSSPAAAQTIGYVVAGAGEHRSPAVGETAVQVAGGVEAQGGIASLVALGVELGYFTPARQLSAGTGVLGVHGLVRLRPQQTLRPFAGAGYARLFRSGANAFTWVVGLDIWTSSSIGLRIDLRDHVQYGSREAVNHHWGLRVGIIAR